MVKNKRYRFTIHNLILFMRKKIQSDEINLFLLFLVPCLWLFLQYKVLELCIIFN